MASWVWPSTIRRWSLPSIFCRSLGAAAAIAVLAGYSPAALRGAPSGAERMSWSWTLYRYLAVQFLLGVTVVYALFMAMAFSIDIVDLLNRTAGHNVATSVAVGMAVLQLPDLGQKMLPFAILLGGVFTFVRLSRSRELVATRAAGVSAWDFLMPPLTVAVLIGVAAVTLFTPISARMFSEFAGLEARYVKGEESQLSVSMNGLVAAPGRCASAIGDPCPARRPAGRASGRRAGVALWRQ